MITRATLLAMLRDVAYDIVCDAASDVTCALIRLLSLLSAQAQTTLADTIERFRITFSISLYFQFPVHYIYKKD